MVQAFIAAAVVFTLVVMSLRAGHRFRSEQRLPMQWSFSGSVTWAAPRRIALSLTPVLATFILIATVTATLVFEPRAGQEGFAVPVILFIGLSFVGVHGVHLWLIERSLRRGA